MCVGPPPPPPPVHSSGLILTDNACRRPALSGSAARAGEFRRRVTRVGRLRIGFPAAGSKAHSRDSPTVTPFDNDGAASPLIPPPPRSKLRSRSQDGARAISTAVWAAVGFAVRDPRRALGGTLIRLPVVAQALGRQTVPNVSQIGIPGGFAWPSPSASPRARRATNHRPQRASPPSAIRPAGASRATSARERWWASG